MQLQYDELDALQNVDAVRCVDAGDKFCNLPKKLQEKMRELIESEDTFNELRDKLESFGWNQNIAVDIIAECCLHLWKGLFAALQKDGLSPKNHKDYSLFTQDGVVICNQVMYGPGYDIYDQRHQIYLSNQKLMH